MSSRFVLLIVCTVIGTVQAVRPVADGTPKYQIGNCEYVHCTPACSGLWGSSSFDPSGSCMCWGPSNPGSSSASRTTVAVGMQQGHESGTSLDSIWVHMPGKESNLEDGSVTIPVNGKTGFIEDGTRNPQLLSAANGEVVAVFQIGAATDPDRARYTCVRDSFSRTFKTVMNAYDRHFKCNMEMTCYPNSVVPETWIKVNQVAGQFGHSRQTYGCSAWEFGGQTGELEWLWYAEVPQGLGVSPEAEVVDNFVRKVGEWLRWKCDAKTCQESTELFNVFYSEAAPRCLPGSFKDSAMKVEGGGWTTERQRDELIAAIQDVLRAFSVRKGMETGEAGASTYGYFAPSVVAVRRCNGGICGTPYDMQWSLTARDSPQANTCGDVLAGVGAAAGLLNGIAGFAAPWIGGWFCPLVSGASGAQAFGILEEGLVQPPNIAPLPPAVPPPPMPPATSSACEACSSMHMLGFAVAVLLVMVGLRPAWRA